MSNISNNISRRDFLGSGSMAALMTAMGTVEIVPNLKGDENSKKATDNKNANKIKIAVIGCGLWGREILKQLSRIQTASIVAICDVYEPFLKRANNLAPSAALYTDYKKVLDSKDVKAVIIATPSHLHHQIAIDALQSGKHVYCEVPLATNFADAKAIAKAASNAKSQIFQAGLLFRSNPIHNHVLQFIRTGALGKNIYCRAQYHKKQSWRRSSPNPEREKAANWHLDSQTSLGLIGEIGIHYLDNASWFLKSNPIAVTGFGGIMAWDDGRDVPDTIKAIIEYPNNVLFEFYATLANSFEGSYEVYYGSDSAILIKEGLAWMMKETDAPLLGWEVYARKEEFNPSKDTGIALIANSTKLLAQGKEPASSLTDIDPPIYYTLEDFINNIHETKQPLNGYLEGLNATVLAAMSNNAINLCGKIVIHKDDLAL
jgi:predicted dehydrogenase